MDLFYKALSILAAVLVALGLLSNIAIIVYTVVFRLYRSKTILVVFLAASNLFVFLSWDYTNYLHPFCQVNYMLFSTLWCRFIVFMQYWSKQWHAWIIVTMTTDLHLAEMFVLWYKKIFNWKGKLVTMSVLATMVFFLNLHLAVVDFKYIKFKFENKTYVKKLQCLDMSFSWVKLHAILCCYAPCVLIIAFNTFMLVRKIKLRNDRNKVGPLSPSKIIIGSKDKASRLMEPEKYTLSVHVVNILFVLLTTPDVYAWMISYFKPFSSDISFTQHMLNFVSLVFYCVHMLLFIVINYKNKKIVF